MKLTIEASAFSRAVALATIAVENRNVIPILGALCLSANGARLTMTGTNLEQRMEVDAFAEVEQPGALALNADRLRDIAAALRSGAMVSLSAKPDAPTVSVVSGRQRWSVMALKADDFPAWREMSGPTLPLSGADLAKGIAAASPAMNVDTTQMWSCGLYLHREGDALVFAATDRKILARQAAGEAPEEFEPVILPAAAAGMIRRAFDGAEEVSIQPMAEGLGVYSDGVRFYTRIMDFEYPEYQRLFPKPSSSPASVDAPELLGLLSRVRPFASLDSLKLQYVRVNLAPGGLGMEASGEHGQSDDNIAVEYDGPPRSIMLVASQIERLLRGRKDTIRLHLGATDKDFVMVDAPADPGWRGMISPSVF